MNDSKGHGYRWPDHCYCNHFYNAALWDDVYEIMADDNPTTQKQQLGLESVRE